MKTKPIIAVAVAIVLSSAAFAQSKSFKLGQWTEIQNSILKELNRSYVDSLPVDRIERAGIDAMLGALDPYTIYIPEEENEDLQMMIGKSYGGIGAVIYKPDKDGNVIINEPYAGSPAVKYGLQCGDEIMEIDGQTTHGLTSQEASDKMKGKPGTTVRFKVKKVYSGDIVDIDITRERIHLPDVEYYGMIDGETGYIYQSGFTENVSVEIRNAILNLRKQGMKKLVLDLRGNGGGLMNEAVNIVSLFVPKGSVVVSSKGNGIGEQSYKTTSEPIDTELPLIVMVDSGSASSSEIVAGALQDLDRATIMGTRTFGKGLIQTIRPLPYNGQIKVTTAKYYTPSGRCVQAIDYAKRNDDGSVGHIPDSLTHEFKTSKGRIVKDGGGITPDIVVKGHEYSRLTYSLVYSAIIQDYALKYVKEHQEKPSHEWTMNDAEWKDFVEFAQTKEFDYRSTARTYFDQVKKELEKDGLAESMKDQLDALEKAMEMDKATFLNLKRDEIVPFIEEEIMVRYYFQEEGVKVRLRYDDQLKEALKAYKDIDTLVSEAGK